jgi:SAM-dependent methyltransferase
MIHLSARFACFAFAVVASSAWAQTPAPTVVPSEFGDEFYRPRSGQAGKDVVWVPTPDALVTRMLQAAKVTDKDIVYDLGAGDGKIPIAAARDFKARAVGIEYNPEMAALARRNAERAGVTDRVKIITGDIFENNFSEATVVTLYLLPDLNYKLRPTILKMKPGTRVVSHQFTMRDWDADEVISENYRDAYLWIVPGNAAGRWTFQEQRGEWIGTADITQSFQRIGGYLMIGSKSQPLLSATLSGNNLAFFFVDADGVSRSIRGTIDGDKFDGWLRNATHETRVSGQRTAAPK